jgi:hypothetical protein
MIPGYGPSTSFLLASPFPQQDIYHDEQLLWCDMSKAHADIMHAADALSHDPRGRNAGDDFRVFVKSFSFIHMLRIRAQHHVARHQLRQPCQESARHRRHGSPRLAHFHVYSSSRTKRAPKNISTCSMQTLLRSVSCSTVLALPPSTWKQSTGTAAVPMITAGMLLS